MVESPAISGVTPDRQKSWRHSGDGRPGGRRRRQPRLPLIVHDAEEQLDQGLKRDVETLFGRQEGQRVVGVRRRGPWRNKVAGDGHLRTARALRCWRGHGREHLPEELRFGNGYSWLRSSRIFRASRSFSFSLTMLTSEGSSSASVSASMSNASLAAERIAELAPWSGRPTSR